MIDNACLNHAANLKDMVPVPSVAGQSRHLEAKHGTNFARTKSSDQTLEPGPGSAATGGYTEIIVDNIYRLETVLACRGDQIVLPPFAIGLERMAT